jgi:hypothetical protein
MSIVHIELRKNFNVPFEITNIIEDMVKHIHKLILDDHKEKMFSTLRAIGCITNFEEGRCANFLTHLNSLQVWDSRIRSDLEYLFIAAADRRQKRYEIGCEIMRLWKARDPRIAPYKKTVHNFETDSDADISEDDSESDDIYHREQAYIITNREIYRRHYKYHTKLYSVIRYPDDYTSRVILY